ncbi:hypothetical protein [Solibacillus sp. FSL K6-1554]|uniref:hypothetical protein n=1 Tax=Solibacillus sp. FSL K6-1554 TaxID=2921472 RepID=UPI0030F9694B
MWTVQSFVREQLAVTANFEGYDYFNRIIGERNSTVLTNVFGTSSSSTIAKNVERVRDENRSLGYTIAKELATINSKFNTTVDNATDVGAVSITVKLDYLRVYESVQSATLFTLIKGFTVTSMKLKDGTIMQ